MEPKIILKEKEPKQSSIASFEIYNPLSDDIRNFNIICSPDECIDGHYLIWEGERMWNGGTELRKVIGIAHPTEVKQKTYELARKFAQERAKQETYGWYNDKRGVPFVDETSRAKEGKLLEVV